MNKLTRYTLFSPMKWLDDELKLSGNIKQIDKDSYYGIMQEIKICQQDESIDDELYSRLNSWNDVVAPEYGYYYANLHYDLFRSDEDTDSIEDRIISFLNKVIFTR